MTTKPNADSVAPAEAQLDHSGDQGAEPSGSTVIFTDITEAPLEPLYTAAKTEVMTEAMGRPRDFRRYCAKPRSR